MKKEEQKNLSRLISSLSLLRYGVIYDHLLGLLIYNVPGKHGKHSEHGKQG